MAKGHARGERVGKSTSSPAPSTRKTRVSQAEVPRYSIQEATRIPQAIFDNYASAPTKPLHLAAALNLSVNSSHFRMLVGASTAYGLTNGAWNSDTISLTDLGKRYLNSHDEDEKNAALREAFLRPRVIGAFLDKYNNARFPNERVASHVLGEFGVPSDSVNPTLKLITEGANALGLLRDIKGAKYVDIDVAASLVLTTDDSSREEVAAAEADNQAAPILTNQVDGPPIQITTQASGSSRVFITHGKNLEIVNQLKELLTFGKLVPIVAAEHETVSQPVPDKVMGDMGGTKGSGSFV